MDDEDSETVTEELATQLNENLAKLAVPLLSSHQQMHLADIIECVATAEKQRRSMDDNAMRYLLFFRQHMLRKGHIPNSRVNITWREIVWAYHSGSQDILMDLISRQFGGRVRWEHARETGMFMWMTDLTALVCASIQDPLLLLTVAERESNSKISLETNIQGQTRRILSIVVCIILHSERRTS